MLKAIEKTTAKTKFVTILFDGTFGIGYYSSTLLPMSNKMEKTSSI